MGLDCSHDAFHGAYSAFNRFRQVVTESIGGSFPPHEDKTLDNDYIYFDDDIFDIESKKGLHEFLHHSDCEGKIEPKMCELVADELEEILPKIEEFSLKNEARGHILRAGGYVSVTKTFIDGCRLAYKENKPLEFR